MNNRIDLKKNGEKIKYLREMENITQANVAKFLSVEQSMISKYENGKRAISSDSLNKLATLFCCPVKTIITDSCILPTRKTFGMDTLTFEEKCILANVNAIILNQLEMDEILYGKNQLKVGI